MTTKITLATMATFTLFFILLLPQGLVRASETLDTDADGLSDYDEVHLYHSDPNQADTDSDGFTDGEEVAAGYSPLTGDKKKLTELDTDGDGLSDALEIALGTDVLYPDTDGDNFVDGMEVANGFNPWVGDNDRQVARTVKVDLTTQQLSYYLNQVKVGSMPVSSGVLSMLTPAGHFTIMKKVPTKRYTGATYDFPNTKWNLQFKNGFYLHGAYWHNQFGIRPMSHGCVNIATANAEKLYRFLDIGDAVTIAGKTPRVVQQTLAKK